jgi:hypothetical protein
LKRLVIPVVLLLVFAGARVWRGEAHERAAIIRSVDARLHPATPALNFRAARPVYPYSIIPGGVRSGKEVEESIVKDPVVAKHYAGVNPTGLMPQRLKTDMDVYSSYRIGNNVYWTNHTIRLKAGELVLSDGVHFIRARCGNRLALARPEPPGPVSPVEPPVVAFESGMPNLMPPSAETPMYPSISMEMPRQISMSEPPQSVPWTYTPGFGPSGGGSIVPPCCNTTTHNSVPETPTTPVTPVPEPASLVLIGTGLSAVALARKWKR